MALLFVDEDGSEGICLNNEYLERTDGGWTTYGYYDIVDLPAGTIKSIIGYEITFEDNPVEI